MIIFNWHLRIGQLYRTGQHHHLAQEAWINSGDWASGDEANLINYWSCVLDAEIPWLQEEISFDEFGMLLEECMMSQPVNKTSTTWSNARPISPIVAGELGIFATPNPGSDRVAIFSQGGLRIMEVRLTDMQGRLLLQESVDDYGYSMNTEFLQPAVYIINCICDDGKLYPIKWVKQ